jgi:hypothetical protein
METLPRFAYAVAFLGWTMWFLWKRGARTLHGRGRFSVPGLAARRDIAKAEAETEAEAEAGRGCR